MGEAGSSACGSGRATAAALPWLLELAPRLFSSEKPGQSRPRESCLPWAAPLPGCCATACSRHAGLLCHCTAIYRLTVVSREPEDVD